MHHHRSTTAVLFIILAIIMLYAGCRISPPAIEPRSIRENREIENKIRNEVALWIGTPHRLGGNSKSGIDCSGLVVRIFDDLYNIHLPRSTGNQVKTGIPLPRHLLSPGDLVFFKPAFRKRHVGIYLGNGEFVHASSTVGVTISRIDDYFWRDVYWTARRIL